MNRSPLFHAVALATIVVVSASSPAQSILRSYLNGAAAESFGRALTDLGDVTGDGIPDFAAGVPNVANPNVSGGGQAGRVDVFSGAAVAFAYPSVLGTFNLMQLGRGVARMPDVNGDGADDLLAGAPEQYPPPLPGMPLPPPSGAWLLSGATGAVLRVYSSVGNDGVGYAVAAIGDLDTDGISEVLAGSFNTNTARIFSGGTGTIFRSHLPGTGGLFGRTLAGVGDIDGDLIPDYAIAATSEQVGGVTVGTVRLYSGATGAVIRTHNGTTSGESFGVTIVGLGQATGDPTPDYAIGASGFQVSAVPVGRVVLIDGGTGLVAASWTGSASGDAAGASLAAVPDVDRDGLADLAFGISGADLAGTDTGRVVLASSTGAVLGTFDGPTPGDRIGSGLATLGDIDGDGTPELVAGASQSGSGGSTVGYAAIIGFGPWLGTCARGEILGPSGRENVLTVNGSSGGAPRRVDLGLGQGFSVAVASPSLAPAAQHLLFGKVGVPGVFDQTSVATVGDFCFPPSLLAPTRPDLFFLATSYAPLFPLAFLPSGPLPFGLTIPGGLATPVDIALQGAIEVAPGTLRPTNAVVLRVR